MHSSCASIPHHQSTLFQPPPHIYSRRRRAGAAAWRRGLGRPVRGRPAASACGSGRRVRCVEGSRLGPAAASWLMT
jgi:hypothetical protein